MIKECESIEQKVDSGNRVSIMEIVVTQNVQTKDGHCQKKNLMRTV
jgi:hypothetical protein